MNFPQDLQVGDILLYSSKDVTDAVIEWKTGSDVAHVEVYMGDGISWASRNGIGVNAYPFRPEGLVKVRRPVMRFNVTEATDWFNASQKNQPYGWGDILATVDIKTNWPGEDCSHFVAALLEVANAPQFHPRYDKKKITPRDFEIVLQSSIIYSAD